MNKILKHITLLLLPFAIIIAFVNLKYDVKNIFVKEKYENKIASIILQGHNADNLIYINDRAFLKNVLTKLPYKTNVSIIGTSRAVEVSSDFFPNKKFINASFLGATINDYVAIVGLLDSCKQLPDSVFIDTSPLLLSAEATNNYELIYAYYNYGIKILKLNNNPIDGSKIEVVEKFKSLFSIEDFQENIKNRDLTKFTTFKDIGFKEPQKLGRKFDCSLVYPPDKYKVDSLKITADIPVFETKIKKINKLDTNNIHVFQKIIDFLKYNNKKVILVNIPLQNDYYTYLKAKWQHFSVIENQIKQLAIKNNISLIGTFNPEDADIHRSNFFDQRHCNKPALKKIFNIIQHSAIQK